MGTYEEYAKKGLVGDPSFYAPNSENSPIEPTSPDAVMKNDMNKFMSEAKAFLSKSGDPTGHQ